MKLTKKLETEILKVYHAYWDFYFSGDIRSMASMLHENCQIIGSAISEVFSDKKSAVKFYRANAGQVTGKVEMRNRKIRAIPVGNNVLVNEQCGFYVLIDNHWTFYGHARIATLFFKEDSKWKVIHQHGSLPDSKSGEEEQISTEQIKAENLQLRDAVKRRTVELEHKNRELEIEATLEKIRNRTLLMKDSGELNEAVAVFFQQFKSLYLLPAEARTYFCHVNTSTDTAEVWMTHADGTVMSGSHFTPLKHSPSLRKFYQAWKRKEPLNVRNYSGKALTEYLQFVSTLPHVKTDKDYRRLFKSPPKRVVMTDANFLQGCIGIMTFEPLSQEALNILVRFAKVFEFTYTRFLDLQKAEEQAREAHIEAALERIRAQAMAMTESADLLDIVVTMRREFVSLGHEAHYFWHMRWSKDTYEKAMTSGDGTRIAMVMELPRGFHEDQRMLKWEQTTESVGIFTYDAEGAVDYLDKMIKTGNFHQIDPNAPEPDDIRAIGGLTFVMARTTHGEIGYSLPGVVPDPPTEDLNTLVRFAGGFDLAYRRFEDLKKAEYQARETQIELALERVRARSMAMHQSDELREVVATLFSQLKELGIPNISNAISLVDAEQNREEIWATWGDRVVKPVNVRATDHPNFKKEIKTWKEKQDIKIKMSAEAAKTALKNIFNINLIAPKKKSFWHLLQIWHRYGFIVLGTWEEASDEERGIIKRFAKVFEQTYTRFLDLKQAEEQAREAQIEAALERVRSRSMAMHKSEELNEVVSELYQQIQSLEFSDYGCTIIICKRESKVLEHWYAGQDQALSRQCYNVPLTDQPVSQKQWNSWLKDVPEFKIYLLGKDKADYVEFVLTETDHKYLPDEVKEEWRAPDDINFYYVRMKYGLLEFVNVEPFDEENFPVYRRFAKVFEQTYTRFLDLKKAEEQAREAQIEAALERVRSRTMAMHTSDELREVVSGVFEEFQQLGIGSQTCCIGILDEATRSSEWWIANAIEPNFPRSYHVPHLEGWPNDWYQTVYDNWRQGVPFFECSFEAAEKHRLDHKLMTETEFGLIEYGWDDIVQSDESLIQSYATLKHGVVEVGTTEPIPEGQIHILQRFAKVIDLCYTRFDDLQQAEEQAREAQIEAALERVRSKSLAMHSTSQLQDVVDTVNAQMNLLGLDLDGTVICIREENRGREIVSWVNTRLSKARKVSLPYYRGSMHTKLLQFIKDGEGLQAEEYSAEVVRKWYSHLFTKLGWKERPAKEKKALLKSIKHYFRSTWASELTTLTMLRFNGVEFASGDHKILERFARVFEQSYTRFLDIQRAETQAREAQIEAALERLRSRTMGMQHSAELGEVAAELFSQLDNLVTNLWTCGFVLCERNREEDEWWLSMDGGFTRGFFLPNVGDYTHATLYEGWVKGDVFRDVQLEGKDLQQHYDWLMDLPVARTIFEEMDSAGLERPDWQKLHAAYFSKGYLCIITREPCSEEQIFNRFAQVFDLTYTRFLDLQKAEEQAREAQIEAALERVRSRAMGMQHSEELAELSFLLDNQVRELGIKTWGCAFHIYQENDALEWFSNEDGVLSAAYRLPREHVWLRFYEAAQRGESLYIEEFKGEDCVAHYEYLCTIPGVGDDLLKLKESGGSFPRFQIDHAAFFKYGHLLFITFEPVPEAHDVFKRFAKVFEQAYTRFLDLQKAEAQAREAQIEAALERVRARTMAMHRSEEIAVIVGKIFAELTLLDVVLNRVLIWIFNHEENYFDWWSANSELESNAESYRVDYSQQPVFLTYLEAWKKRIPILLHTLTGKTKDSWEDYLFNDTGLSKLPEEVQKGMRAEGTIFTTSVISDYGLLMSGSLEPLSDANIEIIQRFGRVFQQAYTRYLDVQKAEAQAREAQIEAALERVRSRTMGMQRSDELAETASILFKQVGDLGVQTWSSGFQIWNADEVSTTAFMASPEGGVRSPWKLPHTEDTFHKQILEARQRGEDFFVFESAGKSLEEVYRYMMTLPGLKEFFNDALNSGFTLPTFQITHCGFFSHGYLMFITLEPHPEAWDIFKRFTKVFEQTYTRFLDLQKAEAQAREAEQQASLDRVRAEIASMRTADDLNRITPLMWRELTTLGVPFFRCGVFIIDETTEHVHAYLSTPTGQSLAALHLKFDSTDLVKAAVQHWRKRLAYCSEWDREQFLAWAQSMVKQGFIKSPKQYLAGEEAPEKLVLQLVPFTQGMLYVGSAAPLSGDEIAIAGTLAEAFAVAYARYEDFQRLEEAKSEVETALSKSDALSKELEVKNIALESENERKARELEEARQLQLSMLPEDVPKVPGLDIAAYMTTATEVGGDYYDFHLAADGTLTVVVGDATGHGLRAGTMVTAAKSLFSSLAERPDIAATFRHMSQSIKSMRLPLLAMCLTMLKIKDGKMKLSSAGIPPTMIYRNASKKLEEVSINGMPLGAMAGFPYREKEVALKPGDTILLMSDGFPERMNDKEKILDYRRAHQAFKKAASESPKKIIKQLVKTGDDWANGRPQDDDVTFVVIKKR